jgi:acetyl esterase/lipase
MIMSIQAFFLRTLLQVRKSVINWDAPVEKFRAELKLSDRFTRLPENVEVKPDLASGVPVEWIIPPNVSSQSLILYIHGGAWTMGWNNLHRRMLSYLCQAVPCRALAVDYRLAPEHPFPAPLEDCLAVYRWLVKNRVTRKA